MRWAQGGGLERGWEGRGFEQPKVSLFSRWELSSRRSGVLVCWFTSAWCEDEDVRSTWRGRACAGGIVRGRRDYEQRCAAEQREGRAKSGERRKRARRGRGWDEDERPWWENNRRQMGSKRERESVDGVNYRSVSDPSGQLIPSLFGCTGCRVCCGCPCAGGAGTQRLDG